MANQGLNDVPMGDAVKNNLIVLNQAEENVVDLKGRPRPLNARANLPFLTDQDVLDADKTGHNYGNKSTYFIRMLLILRQICSGKGYEMPIVYYF